MTTDPSDLPIDPLHVVRILRWLGDLSPEEIVTAIRTGAKAEIAERWPELDADQVEQLRGACRDMRRSRLRAWTVRRGTQPTWLEVRALITGLYMRLD